MVARIEARRHVGHPGPLQRDRVDRAGDEQVVADRDAVPALLGGPAVHPGAPGAVAAEERGDLVVVAGQVVLGEQVDDQRGPRDVGTSRLLGVHASPPSRPSKLRPSLHGTYSCGNHSLATWRWRLRFTSTTAPARAADRSRTRSSSWSRGYATVGPPEPDARPLVRRDAMADGAARRPHHPTAAPRRRPRVYDLMAEAQAHDIGEPAIDLEDIVGDGSGRASTSPRRRSGSSPREARRLTRRSRTAGTRMRPCRPRGAVTGSVPGWRSGPRARRVVRVVRWSGCRCRRAARGPAARAASLPRGLDVLGARAAGRRGDRAAAAAPWLRGARVCAGRGAGRVPGGRGRLQRVAEPDSVDVRGLGGRCGPSAGVRVVEPARRHRPGRCRRRGRVRVPQPGLRLRPVPRRSSRPARSRPRAGPARRLLRGGAGARRVTLRAVHDSRTGALGLDERVGMRVTSTWVHRAIALYRQSQTAPARRCRRAGGTSPRTPRGVLRLRWRDALARAAPSPPARRRARSRVARRRRAGCGRRRARRRSGPPSTASGRDVADAQARGAAGEPAVGQQQHVLAETGALDRAGDGEHLAHPRAALGALVADHHDVAGRRSCRPRGRPSRPARRRRPAPCPRRRRRRSRPTSPRRRRGRASRAGW